MSRFLAGQVALVTGGAQGIGWGIAQALADYGAQVFVCDIAENHLSEARAATAVSPWASQIQFCTCDVSDKAAVEAWVTAVHQQTGRIDILVNNAVYVRWDLADRLPTADIEKMMQVGYLGVVYATQAVLPLMRQAGHGHLVTLGSSAGRLFITPTMAGYSAMKAAVDAYVQILQLELANSPIHVMLVRPAAVAGTNFFRKQVASNKLPRWADIIPYITPPDVARATIDGLRRRRAVVNVPRYLGLMFALFALAPRLFCWLMKLGGNGRLDYGQVEWHYPAHRKVAPRCLKRLQ
ncbi:MAG: SDR family oxidoreductase [Anaerolineaceae bacterium]|nr:SDR family oxidoreductase [Anaerolineaceae bacterium]